ncbi:hypothetical protein GL50803_008516 [Giardia duodenalis]|uniref:Uncharacterized protein n=1 Tax=Giardia intestinalis (strain ATCC 50803 / WB clone C6) TaxID=184922 RepID=A8BBA7_GIAIC|nr:hypothetical protein GL50803_008516 [Giardia intestinalis]KAE8302046.1 hypothetical protein GL50803_008516 [Giardia intestinalis]|eukprot:XP_001708248.1 Hypothetical protein GL50803_8516 [Giardia lamblia ATCC 50803]
MHDLALRPAKEYPRVPRYLSGSLVTLLVGVSAILGSIMLGAIMYLVIDANFCGTNANTHSVSLSASTTLGTNGLTSLLYQTEIPTYDGGYDSIHFSVPDTNEFNPKDTFSFAMLLNYTAYPNANKRSSLVALNVTGNRADTTGNKANSIGNTVSLHISNPTRKRIYVTEPWFDYGYWKDRTQYHLITESDIPLWLVDMKEAGRGRQGRRICTADYEAEIAVLSELFRIDPLIIREFAGESISLSNIIASGEIVLDLASRVQSRHLTIQLLEADITKIYLSKPPKVVRVTIQDRASFLSMVIPFTGAPSRSVYRTIYSSSELVAYIRPSIKLGLQSAVEIELLVDTSFVDQLSCHKELDGSLTFIVAEPTLSRIMLLVAPIGQGACSCEGNTSGQCMANQVTRLK